MVEALFPDAARAYIATDCCLQLSADRSDLACKYRFRLTFMLPPRWQASLRHGGHGWPGEIVSRPQCAGEPVEMPPLSQSWIRGGLFQDETDRCFTPSRPTTSTSLPFGDSE
jgi:hypothetical protein